MKQILYIISFFAFSGTCLYAQPFTVLEANPAWEGSTITYQLSKNDNLSLPPGITSITFQTPVNGIIVSQQTIPYIIDQPVSVTIQWNCLVTFGQIPVSVTVNGQTYSWVYNVSIISHSNYPDFCNETLPADQLVSYSQSPAVLSVSNCSPFCESSYGFIYQWQYADVEESEVYSEIPETDWHNIIGQGGLDASYQPYSMFVYGVRAYRRVTTYLEPNAPDPAPVIVKYSKPAYIRFVTRLDPGSISTSTPVFNSFHNIPVINSSPAVGGLCLAMNYIYTWQATNVQGQWQDIGTGETFPANTEEITYTKRYRRKIQCGSEIKYTNEITVYFNYISENAENRNYVREVDVHVPGQTSWNQVDGSIAIGEKFQNTTYLDGFGRPIQKVSRETGTPPQRQEPWLDNVQFFEYDMYGRQPKQYLPYSTITESGKFKTTAFDEQRRYYEENSNDVEGHYAFSISTFDNSPLNRVINTKAPGKAWHEGRGNSADFYYPLNKESEKIPIVSIGFNEDDLPYLENFYKDNTLIRSKSEDENRNHVITYTNKSGLTVLKKVELKEGADEYAITDGWICTYYVYDDFGRLRYTLEPAAVKYFGANEWGFNAADAKDVLNGLCFMYAYDERGNTIKKRTPGNESLRMAYDKRNRLVLSQDGNMKKSLPAKCNLSLYDDQDRPAISALYNFNQGNDFDFYKNSIEQAAPNNVAGIFQPDLSNTSVTTILKYLYYDNYSFAGAKSFDNGFGNAQAYPAGYPGVQAIQPSKRTRGFATGSSVLVLDGSGLYLNSTNYYDEEGRQIQFLTDNITQDFDIATSQYQWDGRQLSSEILHSDRGTYTRYSIITKNIYDKIGRVQSIEKKIGTNPFKKISSYDYDDMGRVKVKHLDPDYTAPNNNEPDIETLNYSYNIHGQLEGINKDYALKTGGLYSKSGNQYGKFFGLYLGYDKKDQDGNLFDNSLLTGQVAAQVWNTLGDDEQRKYEYTYDAAGRFTSASFWQRHEDGQGWDNTKIDFSVSGNSTDNKIEYDLNGNIISMWQKGILAGTNTPLFIDKLDYAYSLLPNSQTITGNRLKGVVERGSLNHDDNGLLGDFKDDPSQNDKDYDYDDNGNLIYDENKGIRDVNGGVLCTWGVSGIRYNHLDKPVEIHITGKGIVKIQYDADGNKLSRAFESEITGETTATTYIGEFVYTATYPNGNPSGIGNLSYINFEEGRIRVINNTLTLNPSTATSTIDALDYVYINGSIQLPGTASTTAGVFDYYIKDNLQNVRMIVTEEVHSGKNTCTMESNRQNNELPIFDYPAGALIDKNCIPPENCTTTSPWTSGGAGNVVKLSKTGTTLGSNTLQKVMAGDKISAKCEYFYNETPNNLNEPTTVPQTIVNSLLNSIAVGGSVPASVKDQILAGNDLAVNIPGAINTVSSPNETEEGTILPKAYLTMLFFDERFNFVGEGGSQYRRTIEAGDGADPLVIDVPAPKNGYVYIYVSNESDMPVYFDNLEVVNDRGRLIEENHYYPFGLKIATISSVKGADASEGDMKNNRQYQGDYNEFDDELGWNDFALRSYDPQIGRWLQNDPYDEFSSGYVGMGNDPVTGVDPSGGGKVDWFAVLNPGGSSNPYSLIYLEGNHDATVDRNGQTLFNVGRDGLSEAEASLNAEALFDALNVPFNISINISNSNESTGFGNKDISMLELGMVQEFNYVPPIKEEASIGVAPYETNAQKEANNQKTIQYYRNNFYNDDGSKTWIRKLSENRNYQRLNEKIVEPMVVGGLAEAGGVFLRSGYMALTSVAAKGGVELGENVLSTTTRVGKDGNAVEVLFKNGGKMDINAARVKEWVPNLHPNAPAGTLNRVKFDNFLLGSKGFKRTPTQGEMYFLNSLFK